MAENGLMTFASPHFLQCIFRNVEGQLARASRIRRELFTTLSMAKQFIHFIINKKQNKKTNEDVIQIPPSPGTSRQLIKGLT